VFNETFERKKRGIEMQNIRNYLNTRGYKKIEGKIQADKLEWSNDFPIKVPIEAFVDIECSTFLPTSANVSLRDTGDQEIILDCLKDMQDHLEFRFKEEKAQVENWATMGIDFFRSDHLVDGSWWVDCDGAYGMDIGQICYVSDYMWSINASGFNKAGEDIEKFDFDDMDKYVGCWVNEHESRFVDNPHYSYYDDCHDCTERKMKIALTMGVPEKVLPSVSEIYDREDYDGLDYDLLWERIDAGLNDKMVGVADHLFWGHAFESRQDALGGPLWGLWPKGTRYYPDWRKRMWEYSVSDKAFDAWLDQAEKITEKAEV
tara:strand:+ start:9490 stop:10440 length:951 start_codon:yes stop_codon:yes gene_type:complete